MRGVGQIRGHEDHAQESAAQANQPPTKGIVGGVESRRDGDRQNPKAEALFRLKRREGDKVTDEP